MMLKFVYRASAKPGQSQVLSSYRIFGPSFRCPQGHLPMRLPKLIAIMPRINRQNS